MEPILNGYEEIMTHVGGVSLFLEPCVEPAAKLVFSEYHLVELEDEVSAMGFSHSHGKCMFGQQRPYHWRYQKFRIEFMLFNHVLVSLYPWKLHASVHVTVIQILGILNLLQLTTAAPCVLLFKPTVLSLWHGCEMLPLYQNIRHF